MSKELRVTGKEFRVTSNELRVTGYARRLFFVVYKITNMYPEFKYILNSQIIRASISVGSNIEEGRNRGQKEFKRYLSIAEGSAREVMYQLSLFICVTNQSQSQVNTASELCNSIIGMIINLRKSLESHNPKPETQILRHFNE